jgi:hypothetical protein
LCDCPALKLNESLNQQNVIFKYLQTVRVSGSAVDRDFRTTDILFSIILHRFYRLPASLNGFDACLHAYIDIKRVIVCSHWFGLASLITRPSLPLSLGRQKTRVCLWLYDQKDLRLEGIIIVSSASTLIYRIRACPSIKQQANVWYLRAPTSIQMIGFR